MMTASQVGIGSPGAAPAAWARAGRIIANSATMMVTTTLIRMARLLVGWMALEGLSMADGPCRSGRARQQRLRDRQASVLAVLRLMADSNVVGCSTGRSPGLRYQAP